MTFYTNRYLRITATIIDLCLCLFISYGLLGSEFILSITNAIFNIKNLGASIQHLYVYLITYFLYVFYCSLFFSITLGQYVCGVRLTAASAIQKRLGAIMRLILLPVRLILDIFARGVESPISVKLTASRITYRSKVLSYLVATIICVVSIGLTPFSALMYKQQLFSNQFVDFGLKTFVEGEITDFESFSEIGSTVLGFSSFTNLDNSRFTIRPSFEIRKVDSKTIFRPLISIWDTKLENKGIFKISSRFDLYSLVKIARDNLFLFDLYYPELSKVLELSKRGDDDLYYLSSRASLELFELISNAFLVNYKSIPKLILKGHFQFLPYLQLKIELEKLLEITNDNYIDFIKSGENILIRKKDYSGENIIYRETFFSLSLLKPVVYKSIWDRNLDNDKAQTAFSNTLFFKARWGEKVNERLQTWVKDKIFNPLAGFDLISNKTDIKFTRDYTRGLENYLVEYYKMDAKRALESNNEDYISSVRSALQRFSLVFQLAMDKNKNSYSKATIKGFNDILLALKLKDIKLLSQVNVKKALEKSPRKGTRTKKSKRQRKR
ncbi:hypothetical protein ABMA75_12880 [Halobacteriovorax sp. ZH4_bin.1]|uniref:hypothetical protein n=1 Tax=unclassified Halobacteriovorax TaxID=2639665 RepID=UPI0037118FE9